MPAPDAAQVAGGDAELLFDAVQAAGDLAMRYFSSGARSWDKSDGTPVSEADMAVNDLLWARLRETRPAYGWLSEETEDTGDRLSCPRAWVVDPIDGTRSFLERGENWCVSVALVEAGRPVLAAVYAPSRRAFYRSVRGQGAMMNDQPISASSRRELAGSRVMAHEKALQAHRWDVAWPQLETGMATSIAMRLCLVAEGRYDAALAIGDKSDWDLAAGDLILHEAGGRLSNFAGQVMAYNGEVTRQRGFVASGRLLHEDMLTRTRSFKA